MCTDVHLEVTSVTPHPKPIPYPMQAKEESTASLNLYPSPQENLAVNNLGFCYFLSMRITTVLGARLGRII